MKMKTKLILILCLALFGCKKESTLPNSASNPVLPTQAPWFEDVTESSGIDFVHIRAATERFWIPEITGGGAGWIDFDNDGDMDLYCVQGGSLDPSDPPSPGNVLYENQGDGTFVDVTDSAGVGNTSYGMGMAVGDFDADGFQDIYVTNVGQNVLYRNQGDGTFLDVTREANVGDESWGSSAAFADYDNDGDLDLFVTNYIRWSPAVEMECRNGAKERDYCDPNAYQSPSVDRLFQNQGDGTFQDVSEQVGLATAAGNGLGVVVSDFNNDQRLDVYVANDGNPNQLWIQNDQRRFVDQGLLRGCAVNRVGAAEAGMGVASVDIDDDGDLDLFMTHLVDETNTLYVNNQGRFDDATSMYGLASPSMNYTGFGMGFADFNHDGYLDLFIANGRVTHALTPLSESDRFGEPNQLFQGGANGKFTEVYPQGGVAAVLNETSRAAAFADFNGDGATDILIINNGGKARLLSNLAGKQGNWVRFRLTDLHGRDALGARVLLKCNDREQWRTMQRTYSFLASNEPQIHFGLGSSQTIDDVIVHWVNGERESFGPVSVMQCHQLRQGTAASNRGEPTN